MRSMFGAGTASVELLSREDWPPSLADACSPAIRAGAAADFAIDHFTGELLSSEGRSARRVAGQLSSSVRGGDGRQRLALIRQPIDPPLSVAARYLAPFAAIRLA